MKKLCLQIGATSLAQPKRTPRPEELGGQVGCMMADQKGNILIYLDNVFSDVWSGEGVSYLFVRLQNYIHISFTFVQLRCLFKDEMDFGLGFWVGIGVPYFILAGVNYRVFMKLQVKAKMRLMASEGADFQGK